jgi:hypothetical protein
MYKHLLSKYDGRNIEYDSDILHNLASRSEYKSNKNIEDICCHILRSKTNKKYLVNNIWDAKCILRFCSEHGIDAKIEYSPNLTRSNLIEIHSSFQSFCCSECDTKMSFTKDTRPIMYIKIDKSSNFLVKSASKLVL